MMGVIARQVGASTAVLSLYVSVGVCMGYSSSLIPALEAANSDIPIGKEQSAWLASSYVLAIPLGALVPMALDGVLGRLSLVKMMAVPNVASWALIASAASFEQILVGRVLSGISVGLCHSPSMLYVSEVASKNIRGGLSALAPALASAGILLSYVMGALMDWRTNAWAGCAMPALPLALQFALAMESPVWLRMRGRADAAAAASRYFYDDPDMVLSSPSAASVVSASTVTVATTASRDAVTNGSKSASPPAGADEGDAAMKSALWRQVTFLFTVPMAYKPLVIITVAFIIQQVVGVYVIIFYAVTFMQDTGSTLDAYLAAVLVGAVRLVATLGTSFALIRFGRRPLMMISSVGQAASVGVSGYATQCILADRDSMSSLWVVGGLLVYIAFGCLGWQTIPWTMMAEMFPHNVRSLAQPLNSINAHLLMFVMLQLYPSLSDVLGGAAGVQFLFAATSALAALFVWFFLPETRGRTLPEIEDYFRHNVVFVTERRRRRAARRSAAQKALTAKPV